MKGGAALTSYYLFFLQVFGVANPKIHQLVSYYGGVEQAYEALYSDGDKFLTENEKNALESASIEKSEKLIRHCEKHGISIISLMDGKYPQRLRNIFNPPSVLFYKGDLSSLDDEICITAVGTREPTNYSVKLTHRICKDLAKLNIIIVSGMALGLDTVAHRAAIEGGGKTIGVLACGLDVDYPKGSQDLREAILKNGGALLTEYFPRTKVGKGHFQQRNRILSGLSQGTLVLEASRSSGALITAEYAIQQSRDLFCIPPADVFAPCYAGVISYLRDGAVPVFNHLDVVNAYYKEFSEKLSQLEQDYTIHSDKVFAFEKIEEPKEKKQPSKKKTVSEKPVRPQNSEIPYISETQSVIVQLLRDGPKTMDYLVQKSGFTHLSLSEDLIDLEIGGIVRSRPGSAYELIV
jgi:DNA processing protein